MLSATARGLSGRSSFATNTRAREEQADKRFREIIEIAHDASGDYVTTSDGKRHDEFARQLAYDEDGGVLLDGNGDIVRAR